MRKEGNLAGYIRITVFVILLFFSASFANAASLYFSPSSLSRSSGQTFSAIIRVNTEGQAINAAQGSVIYDPAKIEVVSISKAGSIFNLWTQDPTFSNSEGTLSFEGGLPNPGYSGSTGLVVTISFRTKAATTNPGSTDIALISGAILANDGQGTNILTSLGKLTVSIVPNGDTPVQPESTSAPITNGAPQVVSSTHPDSTKWYSDKDPQFSWNLPSDVTGVSYLVTEKATSNPGPQSDGVVSKASFSDITDGMQYFHVKFKENGAWGPIAHYLFAIDTQAPETFEVKLVDAENPKPQITFDTTDTLSGIDHYEIKIDDSSWATISADQAGKPYEVPFTKAGSQLVSIKALDKAGNGTTETLPMTVASIGTTLSGVRWLEEGFNGLINALSNYGLLILLLLGFVGLLIFLFQVLGSSIDKTWHHMRDSKSMRKNEHLADKTFGHLVKDMRDEIKFLNAIGKRRRLGPEEKYLKGKLEQYARALNKK